MYVAAIVGLDQLQVASPTQSFAGPYSSLSDHEVSTCVSPFHCVCRCCPRVLLNPVSPICRNTRDDGELTAKNLKLGQIAEAYERRLEKWRIPKCCDLTCQKGVNDSVRDWQWFGLDGITKDNGHGLMDGMPKSGTTLGGYRRDQPLPTALSRQPVGSIDVFINEGLLCVCNFF